MANSRTDIKEKSPIYNLVSDGCLSMQSLSALKKAHPFSKTESGEEAIDPIENSFKRGLSSYESLPSRVYFASPID